MISIKQGQGGRWGTNRGRVKDGTGPVRAVLNVGNVALGFVNPLDRARLMSPFLSTRKSVGEGGTSNSGRSEENGGEESSEDHFDDEERAGWLYGYREIWLDLGVISLSSPRFLSSTVGS